ncbi:MAG: tetratricopeptide repeat protein [Bacteroidetes bacterium]|nr:tetratricopeptide repeat protein [Bacteroidota bacterium]
MNPFLIIIGLLQHSIIFSQIAITSLLTTGQTDTIIANHYFKKADSLSRSAQYDSAIYYFQKASFIYLTSARKIGSENWGIGETENQAIKKTQSFSEGRQLSDSLRHLSELLLIKYINCQNKIGWILITFQTKVKQAVEHLNNTLAIIAQAGLYGTTATLDSGHAANQVKAPAPMAGDLGRAGKSDGKVTPFSVPPLGLSRTFGQEGLKGSSGFRDAVDVSEALQLKMSEIYDNLRLVYRSNGDYYKAFGYSKKVLSIRSKILDRHHPDIAKCYDDIAEYYWRQGDYETALEYLQQSLLIAIKNLGQNDLRVAETYNNLGIILWNKGDNDKALDYLKRSLVIKLMIMDTIHYRVATTYNNIGVVYYTKGDHSTALENYQKSLSIRMKVFSSDHPHIAQSYINLGRLYAAKNEIKKATNYYNKSIEIYFDLFGAYHPHIGDNYNQLAKLYTNQAEHPLRRSPESSGPTPLKREEYYSKALKFYQQAMQALVGDYNSNSIYTNPKLKTVRKPGEAPRIVNVNSTLNLLDALEGKAEVLYGRWMVDDG